MMAVWKGRTQDGDNSMKWHQLVSPVTQRLLERQKIRSSQAVLGMLEVAVPFEAPGQSKLEDAIQY